MEMVMEKKSSVNITPKSVIINGNLHYKFKMLCKGKSMKIGAVIEDLIRLYLNKQREVQKMIDTLKESQS